MIKRYLFFIICVMIANAQTLYPSLVDRALVFSSNSTTLSPTMLQYRQQLEREVEYDDDTPDPWGSTSWVYEEFDLIFDVFSEGRVQTYLELLSAATGFPVNRIVPFRNTAGARGLAFGKQTLFSIRLVGAVGRLEEITWPPGYEPPNTTLPTTVTSTTRTTTTTTTVTTTTMAPTTTPTTTDVNGTTLDNETTTETTSATTTTQRPTTTRKTTTTRAPPRTLAPATTAPIPTTTPRGGTTAAPTSTTLPDGVTPVPQSPRPLQVSDASRFVNSVRAQLKNLRSPLSLQRLVSIRRVYRAPRTVETLYVGIEVKWVLFVIVGVLLVFLSIYLIFRVRATQEQVEAEYSPSEETHVAELRLLNADDEGIIKHQLQKKMARIHAEKIEYSKAEGEPMPLTRGKLERAQMRQFLREKIKNNDPYFQRPTNIGFDNAYEQEMDAIKAAYNDPQFTSVAAAFAAMDAETGEYHAAENRLSKAEAAEAVRLARLEEEDRKRTDMLPFVQMLIHDHQFALPYSPQENAERKARWIRELREQDAKKGKVFRKKKDPSAKCDAKDTEDKENDEYLKLMDAIKSESDEERSFKTEALRAEAAHQAALDQQVMDKLKGGKPRRDSIAELMENDPMRIEMWKEAFVPGKYEYRHRTELELFDKTQVARSFEADVRKGGWKKPLNNRMVSAGLAGYDLEGNFIFTERDDDQYFHTKEQREAQAAEAAALAAPSKQQAKGIKSFRSSRANSLLGSYSGLGLATHQPLSASTRVRNEVPSSHVEDELKVVAPPPPPLPVVSDADSLSPVRREDEAHIDFAAKETYVSDDSDEVEGNNKSFEL